MIINFLEKNNKTKKLISLLNDAQKKILPLYFKYQNVPELEQKICLILVQNIENEQEFILNCFKNTPSETYLRKTLSTINHHLEGFIAHQKLLETPNLIQHFVQKKALEHHTSLHPNSLQEDDFIHIAPFWQEEQNLNMYTRIKSDVSNIPLILERLDYFYCIEVLYYRLTLETQKSLFSNSNFTPDSSVYVEQLIQHHFQKDALVQLLILGIELQKEQKSSIFEALKTLFFELKQPILPKIKRQLFLILINFSIKQSHSNTPDAIQKTLELYCIGFEQQYFELPLPSTTYRNSIGLAIKAKNYSLAHQFIKTNASLLALEHKESTIAYCEAWLSFEEKNYKKAKKLLQTIDIEDQLLALNSKVLLLKLYYETSDFSSLEYLLDSFKSYIQRKKIQGFYKTYFLKLVKCTHQLIQHTKDAQLLNLKKEVEATPQMASKEWLLEKIERMMNSSI